MSLRPQRTSGAFVLARRGKGRVGRIFTTRGTFFTGLSQGL